MDPVKNSAGNPLNSADFDLLCLETERTHLGGSNAPTHVPIRQKFVPVAQFEFWAKFSFFSKKQVLAPKSRDFS